MDKIDKPGLYSLPEDIHHNQPCIGPSVSRTDLAHFCDYPLLAFSHWSGNPNKLPRTASVNFDFGSAAHSISLGDGTFDSRFVISPHKAFQSNVAKAWKTSQTRIIVKEEQLDQINAMAAVQQQHPFARNAWKRGEPEQSLIWRDEETGLWITSRPDWLPFSEWDWIKDYKTTKSCKPSLFSRDAFNHGYHMQAAMMIDGAKAATGRNYQGVALIAQEKTPPYIVEVFYFDMEQIEIGRRDYKRALRGFAQCLKSGLWPTYSDQPIPLTTPGWVSTRNDEDYDNDDSGNDDGAGDGNGEALLAG